MNRLWVRFSLAFVTVTLLVVIVPSALIFLLTEEELLIATRAYIIENGIAQSLSLNDAQLAELTIIFAQETRQDYLKTMQNGAIIGLIAGTVAGIFFSRGLSRPIVQLAQATQSVTSHNPAAHVPEKGATELKALARNFNQMTDALAQAESTRQHLLADVSHELLTPLTVLEGNLRAILDDVYELKMEEIEYLYEQTHQLIYLVKELRQLSLAEAGKLPFTFERLDFVALAQETVSLFTPLVAEKKIQLQTELPTIPAMIAADPARLRQVLHNLLANAVRHTPENGRITLHTTQNEQHLQFTITDNGDGIPPEQLPHIFDRFYRAHNGNSGLGLAIVQAIIHSHHGQIQVTSPGKKQGATFTCILPNKQPNPIVSP